MVVSAENISHSFVTRTLFLPKKPFTATPLNLNGVSSPDSPSPLVDTAARPEEEAISSDADYDPYEAVAAHLVEIGDERRDMQEAPTAEEESLLPNEETVLQMLVAMTRRKSRTEALLLQAIEAFDKRIRNIEASLAAKETEGVSDAVASRPHTCPHEAQASTLQGEGDEAPATLHVAMSRPGTAGGVLRPTQALLSFPQAAHGAGRPTDPIGPLDNINFFVPDAAVAAGVTEEDRQRMLLMHHDIHGDDGDDTDAPEVPDPTGAVLSNEEEQDVPSESSSSMK